MTKTHNGNEHYIYTLKEFEEYELQMPSCYDEGIDYPQYIAISWDEFEKQLAEEYYDESCDATVGDFEEYVSHIGQDYVGESKTFESRSCPDVRIDINAITTACVHIGSEYIYFEVILDSSCH